MSSSISNIFDLLDAEEEQTTPQPQQMETGEQETWGEGFDDPCRESCSLDPDAYGKWLFKKGWGDMN